MSSGKLYVVSTPIGNLNEFSPRALEILKSVDLIASEDTRSTLKLCSHFNIEKQCVSLHEHNEKVESLKLIPLLKEGKNIALTSDAGYPGISDPGAIFIRDCIEEDIKIEVISGPCALINALVGSGLDTTHFYFYGFLPAKKSERVGELNLISNKEETIIFYESPHRIASSLEDMMKVLGNRRACIARELTKIHEEYIRGSFEDLITICNSRELKGEMVVVVEGYKKEEVDMLSSINVIDEVNRLISKGMSAKDAIKEVSSTYNLSKNEVYRLYHQ